MINVQDPKSGSPISETPSDYYRNNGYYRYLEYQLTQALEMNIVISVGQYPLIASATIETQGQAQYLFKEGVEFSGGTAKVPFCYNRVTQIPFESTFKVGATITSAVTVLRDRLMNFGTNPGQFSTGGESEIAYFILDPNTNYSMQLIPSVSMRMTIDLRIVEKH